MKTKILLIIFSILLLLPGCQTIKDKSDKIVQEYLDDAALVRKNAAKKLGL